MSLSLPGMDGVVLADALQAPAPNESAVQARLSPTLTADQDAMISGYASRVSADRRQNLHPPPVAPLRP